MDESKVKETLTTAYDCSRGCVIKRSPNGAIDVNYRQGCCKLSDFDWLEGIRDDNKDIFEVRFKNTRKLYFRNASGQVIREGDLVVVEAVNGHDVGIVSLEGPLVMHQLAKRKIDPATYEFRKIYRKAKVLDIERWQEAVAREQAVMIRSRQIAARLGLDMKIGDVEFQGDGSKAIFYYIADQRVDFRQLIKDFASEFGIRVEMRQIGARQEAGLIGGLGVCGRALCCSGHMTDFQSITTQAARVQDLSLNPQKLAGQCSKLKCCINHEASVYVDAHKQIPTVREPLEFQDGQAFLVKTDILRGLMYFSYDKDSLVNIWPLSASRVYEIISMNRQGIKPESLKPNEDGKSSTDFVSAVGDDSITRFDKSKKASRSHGNRNNGNRHRQGGRDNRDNRENKENKEKKGNRGNRDNRDGNKSKKQ